MKKMISLVLWLPILPWTVILDYLGWNILFSEYGHRSMKECIREQYVLCQVNLSTAVFIYLGFAMLVSGILWRFLW